MTGARSAVCGVNVAVPGAVMEKQASASMTNVQAARADEIPAPESLEVHST